MAVSAMSRSTSLDRGGSARGGLMDASPWCPHGAASGAALCVLSWSFLKKQVQDQDSLRRFYAKKVKLSPVANFLANLLVE